MRAASAASAIPYARFLDVRVETTESGVICVMPFRDDLVGNVVLPAIHGGVIGAFLELTALLQLLEVSGERVARPINFSIDYLRSAGPKETRGRAEIVKHGRRIANVRVVAWQDDADKPVAAGIGNFLL
ncbi:MAG TPA: PaaI family thioesterase [Candidatus Binatia bacterium]